MALTQLEEKVLQIIGETGMSRMQELKKEFPTSSYPTVFHAVKELAEQGLLSNEILRIGGSGKYNFFVFELTEKGKKEAARLIQKQPVVSQKQQLQKKHGDLKVAYLFEDCLPLLKEKGIELTQAAKGYNITIANKTYPLFIDAGKDEEKYTMDEYFEKFDEMYVESSTLFYLSPSKIQSSFLILDQVEAWMKTRLLNQQEKKPFEFYSCHMGRIFEGCGDQWDSLVELWTEGILRWHKTPSI